MATINFPNSPSVGDLYSFGKFTWIYNGQAWDFNALNGAAPTSSFIFVEVDYVDTLIVLPQPQETFTLINFV